MENPTRNKLIEQLQNESKHAHADMRYHEGRMSAFLVAEEIVRNVWEEIENENCTCEREVTKKDLCCDPEVGQ